MPVILKTRERLKALGALDITIRAIPGDQDHILLVISGDLGSRKVTIKADTSDFTERLEILAKELGI